MNGDLNGHWVVMNGDEWWFMATNGDMISDEWWFNIYMCLLIAKLIAKLIAPTIGLEQDSPILIIIIPYNPKKDWAV